MRTPLMQALQDLQTDRRFADHVAAWHCLPARPAGWAPLPSELDPRLVRALQQRGIAQLYSHQAQAVAAAQRGEDVTLGTYLADEIHDLAFQIILLVTPETPPFIPPGLSGPLSLIILPHINRHVRTLGLQRLQPLLVFHPDAMGD